VQSVSSKPAAGASATLKMVGLTMGMSKPHSPAAARTAAPGLINDAIATMFAGNRQRLHKSAFERPFVAGASDGGDVEVRALGRIAAN
jgi:hypothetical protein